MEFRLQRATDEDFAFAYEAKRDAIGPHVSARWGWDEALQLEHHRKRWREKPWEIIVTETRKVGTVSINVQATHVQFGEFYILQPFRRCGLGAQVLKHALELADRHGLETRLEYLKWNPVATLYARHGFRVVGETDVHYLLVRAPRGA